MHESMNGVLFIASASMVAAYLMAVWPCGHGSSWMVLKMNHQTSLLNSNEELSERSNCRVITIRARLYGVRLIQANLLEGEPVKVHKSFKRHGNR